MSYQDGIFGKKGKMGESPNALAKLKKCWLNDDTLGSGVLGEAEDKDVGEDKGEGTGENTVDAIGEGKGLDIASSIGEVASS